ncbi:MAG: hypothetical protein JJ975_06275 [Bacteroidia bacterium]|nr:hypothetical protein [Bacteroidia bacterium]
MKTSRIYLILCCIMAVSVSAQAQSLRIVYDFIQDDIKYYRTKPGDAIGKEIGSPIVGRNKLVTVEVVNFNKFVYAANATYTSKVVESQSDIGFLDIVSPLINPLGSGSFFTSLGGNLPEEIGRGGVLSTRGASSAYDDILNSYKQLTQLESSMKSVEYAIQKLNKLKYNPYLPTDTIVNMSNYIVGQIFNKPVVNPSDFSAVIVSMNKDYGNSIANLKTASVAFLREYNDYASRNTEAFEGRGLDQVVRNFNSEVQEISKTFNPDYITNQIDYLETVYTSIMATRFVFNSSHAAKDDEIELMLNFYKIPLGDDGQSPTTPDLNNLTSLPKVKDKKVSIVVKGDMKVTTSIGLAFPRFETSDDFINKDSFIVSQPGGKYSPNLAAYVNFYPYTGRTVNLGGTFGVGVPLQSENRNVNMFMGLTALFGSDSRVSLHGGFSLGQVKQLGEGYEVGDKLLSTSQEVPIRNIWEWGSFVGISFNISKTGN